MQQTWWWITNASFISIVTLTATIATIISIGVQALDHVESHATPEASFVDAFPAVTNIVFAYGMFLYSTWCFLFDPSLIWITTSASQIVSRIYSEMEDHRDIHKSLAMLQVMDATTYVVIGIVIYCHAGPDVASPAFDLFT